MRDPATEADLLRSLSDAYQEIIEARRNAGSGGAGKGARYVQDVANTPVGYIQDKEKGKVHTGMDQLKKDAAKEKKAQDKEKKEREKARKARIKARGLAR